MAYEQASYATVASPVHKNLLAGTHGVTTRKVTIASGAGKLIAGTVIGKITAGGKYVTSASAAANGSETPDMVLAQDVDATAADAQAIAYETATVVASALTLGAGHSVASIREGLRGKGIKIDD